MPRALAVVQFLISLLRYRAARAVLWVLLAVWLFDRLVYSQTEMQWFASAGVYFTWVERYWAQKQLFGVFSGIALLLMVVFLRPITSMTVEQRVLRGKLARFEALRSRMSRLSWTLALLVSLLEAYLFTHLWPEWLLLRSGAPFDFRYLGLPSNLWTQWLPVVVPLLHALWFFSWFLFGLMIVTGVLRALPELAARRPVSPRTLTGTLWMMAAWLLLLRAVMHVTGVFDLVRGRVLQSGDVFISAPLFLIGALACLCLAAGALRQIARSTSRQKFSKLVFTMLAAIWLPGLVNWLSSPVRALLPETAWLKRERQRATIAAWELDFQEADATAKGVVPWRAWAVWDEKMALEALGSSARRKGKVVVWKSTTFNFHSGKWRAVAAAQNADASAWNSSRETGESTETTLERLEFPAQNGGMEGTPLPMRGAYFGFAGGSLFGDGDVGVPFDSIPQKLLWAWRLRDVLLPFEGANSSRLLVYRGAAERAARIAPFLKLGSEPRLVFDGYEPWWMLDLCATTTNFPGAMRAPDGPLAGTNGASDSIKMLVSARTGKAQVFAPWRRMSLLESSLMKLPPDTQPAATDIIGHRAPDVVMQQWRPAPELLRTQLQLWDRIREQGRKGFIEAQTGLGANGLPVTRALAIGRDSFESLEAAHRPDSRRVLRRADFDLTSRLAAIDLALAKSKLPTGRSLVSGQPFVWPDAVAPGGFRIGRAFFSVPHQQSAVSDAQQPKVRLWRVALTGVAENAKISLGETVHAAYLDMLGVGEKSAAALSPAAQALKAHKAAQAAAEKGDWATFGRESRKERQILEQMVAQSAAN